MTFDLMERNRQAKTLLIEQRRQQVAELYLQCQPQAEIARQLDVSQGTVSNDLRAVRRQWRESAVRDFDEAVSLELAKLERLEREAWKGWNQSLAPTESTRVTQDGSAKRAEKTVRQQQGDPRYLEQVQRCIAARRALLGLDAPTRIAPTSPDGEQSYHSYVMSELMKLAEETRTGPVIIDSHYVEQHVAAKLAESQDDAGGGEDA